MKNETENQGRGKNIYVYHMNDGSIYVGVQDGTSKFRVGIGGKSTISLRDYVTTSIGLMYQGTNNLEDHARVSYNEAMKLMAEASNKSQLGSKVNLCLDSILGFAEFEL